MADVLFREDHRWGSYLWFWVVPIGSYLDEAFHIIRTHQTLAGSWVWSIAGPLLFVVVFAPCGYRITVQPGGLRVTGLGFMRIHEAFYAWIWRRASVAPGEAESVVARPQRGLLRHINWPMLFPFKRSRQHFAFGTPVVVEVKRKDRKPLTLGTREPEELVAALGRLGRIE